MDSRNNKQNKKSSRTSNPSDVKLRDKDKPKVSDVICTIFAIFLIVICFAGSCLLLYYGFVDFRIDWLLGAGCGFTFCFTPIIAAIRHRNK